VEPVVVVAHPRSGSNSLVELVSVALPHPLLNEPFNERHHTWSPDAVDWRSRVHDVASLDEVFAEITATWSGIKALGYQLDLPLLEHLLLRPDVRVIRLRRRNLLETVVSNLVAVQTNLWRATGVEGALDDHYGELAPIEVDDVRDLLRHTRTRLDEVEAIVDRRTGPTLHLEYEDVYLHDTAAQLARLWRFLDVPAPADERLRSHLDPTQARMARPSTYGRVPNIAEIEAALGSDDVGHLTYL
jgi:LPS sulfotransferase NodH